MQIDRLGKVGFILRSVNVIKQPRIVSAHCDVPCGVYEPDSMKWAAETCYQLTKKLLDRKWAASGDSAGMVDDRNFAVRAIHTKEEFAERCKREILILWTDWFKPEHLQKYPNLHETIWKATKQCSTVKRSIKLEECEKLKGMVSEIARIFLETKKEAK